MDDQSFLNIKNEGENLVYISRYIACMFSYLYGKSDKKYKNSYTLLDTLILVNHMAFIGFKYSHDENIKSSYPEYIIKEPPHNTPYPKYLTEKQKVFIENFRTSLFNWLEQVSNDNFKRDNNFMKIINSLKNYANKLK